MAMSKRTRLMEEPSSSITRPVGIFWLWNTKCSTCVIPEVMSNIRKKFSAGVVESDFFIVVDHSIRFTSLKKMEDASVSKMVGVAIVKLLHTLQFIQRIMYFFVKK